MLDFLYNDRDFFYIVFYLIRIVKYLIDCYSVLDKNVNELLSSFLKSHS